MFDDDDDDDSEMGVTFLNEKNIKFPTRIFYKQKLNEIKLFDVFFSFYSICVDSLRAGVSKG